MINIGPSLYKKCKKCSLDKELSFFSKDKNSKDGHLSRCKTCKKEYDDIRRKDPRVQEMMRQNDIKKLANPLFKSKQAQYDKNRYPLIKDKKAAYDKQRYQDPIIKQNQKDVERIRRSTEDYKIKRRLS